MMKKIIIGLLVIVIAILSSCTVTKRHYMPGYHVQWHNNNFANKDKADNSKTEKSKDEKESIFSPLDIATSEMLDNDIASVDNNIIELPPAPKLDFTLDIPDSCDVLITKDGEEIDVKITEITETEIKYKKCSGSGPVYTKKLDTIFKVKYSDGSSEMFKTNSSNNNSNQATPNNNNNTVIVNNSNSSTPVKKKKKGLAIGLWCLTFLGLNGIHRFVTGHYGLAILEFLTFGGCLIWQIIDLIRLLSGSLKPKDGEWE